MQLKKIVETVNGVLSDSSLETLEISGISSVDLANENQISFIVKKSFALQAQNSKAAAIFVGCGWEIPNKATIAVKDPYFAYAVAARLFEDDAPIFGAGISQNAIIDKSAKISEDVCVAHGAVIGENVRIGKRTKIDARVVVEKNVIIGDDCHIKSGAVIHCGVKIGSRVIIESGAVIGSDGFANAFLDGKFMRIACFGSVLIEDDVEIGANTTVDRGNFIDTVIRKGARIDNLVMVAHNCEIGESCGIAAQVGFAGSTKIGKRVMVAGQAGFGGHIEIGDDSFVGGQAGIVKSFPENSKITGSPAIDLMKRRKIDNVEEKLPEMARELKKLRQDLDEIKEKNK